MIVTGWMTVRKGNKSGAVEEILYQQLQGYAGII